MDIDDILADIDAPHASAPSSAALDVQRLTRAWVSERAAPELLEWPGELMEHVMERVAKQVRP
jgi:GINS complex subunit 4